MTTSRQRSSSRAGGAGRMRGATLIELMVASAVGLLLLAGLVSLLANSRKGFEVQDYSARLQESARHAFSFLSQDLRMAGYYGCAGAGAASLLGIKGLTPGDDDLGDRVQIRFADPDSKLDVSGEIIEGATALAVTTNAASAGYTDGDTVMIADCGGAESATISGTPDTTITLGSSLARSYGERATVRRLVDRTYWASEDADGLPALVRLEVGGGGAEDLVHGVEHLRVLYGVDGDGDSAPDDYRAMGAMGAGDWSAVVGLRVGVLVRGVSNYRPDINPSRQFGPSGDVDAGVHTVLDQTLDLDDLRTRRRVFTTTIKLRNYES